MVPITIRLNSGEKHGRHRSSAKLVVHNRGLCDYATIWDAMREFTASRTTQTPDEIWLLEHPPVYTLGLAGKRDHIFDVGATPIIHSDRGGQVTYHGPGQLIAYTLIDLRRRGLTVGQLIAALEQAVIDLLTEYDIVGERHPGAPGIYVGGAKIAALGLRIRRGCSYHGVALNVAMDLEPFGHIDPCGYPDLKVTQLAALNAPAVLSVVHDALLQSLIRALGYDPVPMLR